MSIVRTWIDWAIKDEADPDDFFDSLEDPQNETELYVLGLGLLATSIIGTVWVTSKVVKGGAKVHRFLKR